MNLEFLLVAPFLAAAVQHPLSAAAPQSLDAALASFRDARGPGWRIDVDPGTGQAEFLYGSSTPMSFRPRSDEEWFLLAREALAETQALHGIEALTLVEERATYLPLAAAGTTDKVTVRFRQALTGVPVDAAAVNVLFSADGRLLAVQAHALPHVDRLDLTPTISAAGAAEIAVRAFAGELRLPGESVAAPELCIAQVQVGERRVGVLAWRVDVQQLGGEGVPQGFVYFVDARDGRVAARQRSVHEFDVSGTVTSMATGGLTPDLPSNPPTLRPLAYATVSSGGVTTTADANGAFTLVGVDAPATLTVGYDGSFNDVRNQAGPDHSVSYQAVTASGNQIVLNGSPTQHVTSQANAAIAVNAMRDWVRAVNPLDSHADFVHVSKVNINQSCNAFYNGGSINFFVAAGSCVNTAYSTVVAHEDGHWLNDVYGTGNGGDGMGEGNADVWAMYLYDDPIVGRGFCGTNCNVRSGNNTRQFCGECCGGCYGEVHADGEVWMGAAWKIRRNLNTSLGNAAGDAVADALFLAWMNSNNQQQIKSVIEAQWLTLDDDDGDLDSGTPHFAQIDAAFREQGFPGVTLAPLHIAALAPLASTPVESGPYDVDAEVYANTAAGVTSVELFYRTLGGSYVSVPMSNVAGVTWRAAIPDVAAPTKVYYYVRAQDSALNVALFPAAAPSANLFFTVGPTVPLFSDTCELDLGWGVDDVNVTAGSWVRGAPIGTYVGNKPAQPDFDDPSDTGGRCWFTGQGAYFAAAEDSDLDGGPTRLVSPLFDLTGSTAEIAYSYWFYTSVPGDTLQVELTADGANWIVVRSHLPSDGEWLRDVIDVSSELVPSATVQLRFSVADFPNDSITEAAIDHVTLTALSAAGCVTPQVYCTGKINSQFCTPVITSSGTPSSSSPLAFTIGVTDVINNKTGLLFYSHAQAAKSFAGGILCCATPVRRTPQRSSGGSPAANDCSGSLTFDMNAWIRSGIDPSLVTGATVAAQFYYRDPQDPHTVGLSDAVWFGLCP